MTRLCERPGCSQPADVMYGIDADTLTVWIQALDVDAPSRPGVLCRGHADAMVVPLRWTLDDRREPVPRLFRPPAIIEAAAPERVRRTPAPVIGTQLELDGTGDIPRPSTAHAIPDEVVDTTDTTDAAGTTGDTTGADDGPDAPPDAAAAVAWKPVFDTDDDLGGLLRARSPLLSRAFHGRERRPAE